MNCCLMDMFVYISFLDLECSVCCPGVHAYDFFLLGEHVFLFVLCNGSKGEILHWIG